MPTRAESGRANQRYRTRKDLLDAAAALLKKGRTPSMDDVATAALVSRATAYRYFPSIEALLVEVPIEGAAPDPATIFASEKSTDPAQRLDKAEAALHEMCYRNERQLRIMLAASLERTLKKQGGSRSDAIPVRQNRRTRLIQAALEPARARMTDATYERLCASLALIFGTESMIVFSDVLAIEEKAARRIKSWAVRALVAAALENPAARR